MTQASNLAKGGSNFNADGDLSLTTGVTGTLPVANGGTGNTSGAAASLTNALTIGTGLSGTSYNGSSAVTIANSGVTSISAGTGISISGATGAVTVSASGGSQPQIQFSLALRGSATNSSGSPLVFNSTGSCTWTCPTGVTKIKLVVVGGAGGGGGGVTNAGSTLGGYGGFGIGFYTVTPGTAYSITIGAGGAGGGGGGTGGTGGSSSFGSILTATGGTGGVREFGQRTNGAAALGTIKNTNVGNGFCDAVSTLQNSTPNVATGGVQAAQTYTISLEYSAGSAGRGGSAVDGEDQTAGGGVSGAVYIEYVGS